MTQSGSNKRPGDSGGARPPFGTQVAGFGQDGIAHAKTSSDQAGAARSPSGSGSAGLGTMMARPVHELADRAARDSGSVPEHIREVTRTHRAGSDHLRLLAQLARDAYGKTMSMPSSSGTIAPVPGMNAGDAVTRTIAKGAPDAPETDIGGRTMHVSRPRQESPAGNVGKTTWHLRIPQRQISGHLSGIVNRIPTSSENLTGLMSAFAIDPNSPEYEVTGELGAGAMGIVYNARQLCLNRELAIKTLKGESGNPEHDQAMFVSEAVVTANLVHPNIVPIHDLGRSADGKLFYSMKKVTGVPWHEVLLDKSLEENLDIYMKLCDAVAYAHSRGVINRDLKPENVVVGNFGEVVVLDWGLAITTDRFEKKRSVLLTFLGCAGTPAYMAPELLDDDVTRVGPHSDIYLLGAILFEILEGFQPHMLRKFQQMTDPDELLHAVYWAVINNDIEKDVKNHGELMQIAMKAMSAEPADRFGSVEELQEAIREYRITGRADELLSSVDLKSTTSYTEYQSAVALYSEALRKWPSNRRALEGDRRARWAYAQLARRKGDFDLGLQVVEGQKDPEFQTLSASLRKSRLVRSTIRTTWMLTTVSAVAAMLWGFVQLQNAQTERNNALAAERVAKEEKEAADQLRVKAEDDKKAIEALAGTKKQLEEQANLASTTLLEKERELKEKQQEISAAMTKASAAQALLEKAEAAKTQAQMEVVAAEGKLSTALTSVAKAQKDAAEAEGKLSAALMAAEAAQEQQLKYELEGFNSRLNAADKLGDYTELINIAEEALEKAKTNHLIEEKRDTLDKRMKDAQRKLGNASIQLPFRPDAATVSLDGSTVIAMARSGVVTVLKSATGFVENDTTTSTVTTPVRSAMKTAVSAHGRYFAVTTRSEGHLYAVRGDLCEPIALENAAGGQHSSNIGWSFFSADERHLYLVREDDKATVEIYSTESGKLLARQPLAGNARGSFRIRDIALVPDESALIVQFSLIECYEYRMTWKDGIPSFGSRLANTAPVLKSPDSIPGLPPAARPDRVFVSPDSQWLALAFAETVVLLPRLAQPDSGTFSYAASGAGKSARIFRCTFSVQDLCFAADNQRIATGHGNRYIQIWDLKDDTYIPCQSEDLFRHRFSGGFAACLRGHSDEDSATIKGVAFVSGDADQLVSVSTDSTLKSWKVSEYGTLKSLMMEVRQTLDPDAQTAADSTGRTRRRKTRQHASGQHAKVGHYILTGLPAEPATQPATPRRLRQGQGIFSARFSPDSQRILIGADDLAAHVFDSHSGERVLSASMAGRKDLFFDPDRNNFLEGHISEISSIQFLPPAGELLLTADYFGSISVWDALADDNGIGYERSRLLSEYSFSEFAVSADGTLVLAGGAQTTTPDGPLKDADLQHLGIVWRTEDMLRSPGPAPFLLLRDQHPKFAITAVAISPESKLLATAGRRGRIVIWDATDGHMIAMVPESHDNDQVAGLFFESETQLVSAGYNGKVYRWTLSGDSLTAEAFERPAEIPDPEFIVRLRPSPDRSRFTTSEVSVIRSETGKKTGQLQIQLWSQGEMTPLLKTPVVIPENDKETAFRHDISWSSDGQQLLFVQDGVMTVYEIEGLKPVSRYRLLQNKDPQNSSTDLTLSYARPIRGALAPTIDGGPLRAATFDGRFSHLWDLTDGRHLAEFRSHAMYSVIASFSPDQKFVATASETLRIFDGDEASPNHGSTIYRQPVRQPHQSPLADVQFNSMNGQQLATVDLDGTVELWTWSPGGAQPLTPFGEPAKTDIVHPEWATDLKFGNAVKWNVDGGSLYVIQRGEVARITLDGQTLNRSRLPLPEGLDCRFNQLDISNDGKVLTAGGVAWNDQESELVAFAAVWLLDGESLQPAATISGEHSTAAASKTERAGITGDRTGIMAIAIDEGLQEILTGGADGRLIRWNMTGFRPDSTIQLDRIADIREANSETAHRASVTSIDVAKDGRIVTSDQQGVFILWPSNAD
jgi:serine/threonine protein kinase/WD40 repeat protein